MARNVKKLAVPQEFDESLKVHSLNLVYDLPLYEGKNF